MNGIRSCLKIYERDLSWLVSSESIGKVSRIAS
jgi:hypothetical protein